MTTRFTLKKDLASSKAPVQWILTSTMLTAILLLSSALMTVGAAEADKEEPVCELIEKLSSDGEMIRSEAADKLHGRAQGVFNCPPLFDDQNAIGDLEKFRTELKTYLPALQRLAESADERTRGTAMLLLANIRPAAKAIASMLLDCIRSKEMPNNLQMNALLALMHVTPLDEAIGPTLIEVCVAVGGLKADSSGGNDWGVDQSIGIEAVLYALLFQGSGRTSIEIPSLMELTEIKFRREIRLRALATIILLKEEAQPAAPGMRKLLTDEDPLIRQNAGLAILELQGSTDELPDILTALQMNEKDLAEFQETVAQDARDFIHRSGSQNTNRRRKSRLQTAAGSRRGIPVGICFKSDRKRIP